MGVERHTGRNAANESQAAYRGLYHRTPIMLHSVDGEGRIVRVSDYWLETMGYLRSEVVGRPLTDFLSEASRRYEEEVVFPRFLETGSCRDEEYRLRTKEGREFDVTLSAVADWSPDGSIRWSLAVITDVSSLKRAQDELRERELELARTNRLLQQVLDTIPVRVFWKDLDLRYLGCNRLFAEDAGLERPDELLGRDDYAMGWKAEADLYRADDKAVIDSGESRVNYEEPQTTPEGEHIWLRTSKMPLNDVDGTPIGVLGTYEDITDEKRAEKRERQLQAQVQHAQKLESLGVLAGGIAHDFNNLLTGILGQAELVLADLSPVSPARQRVEAIRSVATTAADLCRQMLAYSGRGRFVVEPIDLSEVVREMSHMLDATVSKKVSLRYDLAEGLPSVEADAAQMQQIVLNLVLNASEAIEDGNGIVTVRTSVREYTEAELRPLSLDESLPGGTYVSLQVSDTGCGMDAATLEKIFEPFFTTKFTGRGLGLAAALGIVRGHRGAIRAASEPGMGTQMELLLPSDARPASAVSKPQHAEDAWHGSGTVLVVDDEDVVRDVAQGILETVGLDVLVAEDGREALAVFKEHADEIDCVLLDLTMPHLDGAETFAELKNIRPDVRVLLASGYSQEEVTQRFEGQGLAGFIQKPFRMQTLIDRIREVL